MDSLLAGEAHPVKPRAAIVNGVTIAHWKSFLLLIFHLELCLYRYYLKSHRPFRSVITV